MIVKEFLNVVNCGVKVCIFLDDNGVYLDFLDIMFLNFYKNIEVKIFNFYYICNKGLCYFEMFVDYECIKKCMYNKFFIVDNFVVIIGGCNIGDNYFDNDLDMNFLDLDVLFFGGVVLKVKESFECYWRFYCFIFVLLLRIYKRFKNNVKEIVKFYEKIFISVEDINEFEKKVNDFIEYF